MNLLPKSLALVLLALLPTIGFAAVDPSFGALPALRVSGKEFVDEQNRPVTLHGVMDTPNDYFNGNRWSDGLNWPVYQDSRAVGRCIQYFKHVLSAIANPAKGTYCNLFRLHLDPAWTNDPDKKATNGGNENDISRFSANRLRTYLSELYIPIVEEAHGHGLYVIIRPPGVFPEDVSVGDAYNDYLFTVWDIVSQNPYVKAHPGQIMLELGNEPVRMSGNLADYFQPIVNKIRENGFTGILLLPGTSYQADYRSYNTKAIEDNNFGYAVHNYPGWYGGWDSNQTEANFISTFEAQVPVDKKPIVITEVDWSPMKDGAGHWNELHTQYTEGNFGTWATATTNSPAPNVPYKNTQNVGWGMRFKHLVDKHPNISWTLQGTTTYVDMDAYLKDGTVQPAFTDQMKDAGYSDAGEACSKTSFDWYYQYACGDRIPYGTPNVKPEEPIIPTYRTTAEVIGDAEFNKTNAHYIFYKPSYSSFVFKEYVGKKLADYAELYISLGQESTIGYRLDVQLKDASGNLIESQNDGYIIGTEDAGTRMYKPQNKVYELKDIFNTYLSRYPDCTIGNIRLNTVVNWGEEDNLKTGKYFFTIDEMGIIKGTGITARAGSKGTSLADIKMYSHENTKNVIVTDDAETAKMGGWGGTITRTAGAGVNGSYGYVLTNEQTLTYKAQVCYEGTYPNGTEYTLSMDIKGEASGSLPINFQKSEGYVGCGSATINYTTEWQTVIVPITVNGEGANRLLFDYGGKSTLSIDNVKLYTGEDKVTEITSNNIKLGEEIAAGAEIFGAGLLGNVARNEYADLTEYSKMIIKGTGGSLRVLYNRPETGDCPELNPTLASGEAEINLTADPYFHLNSIKAGWGQTVNVESITLIDGSGNNIEIADYYISGAGHEDESLTAALADANATVIDLQGYTGMKVINFESANPNCLLIYKDGSKVGSAFDPRNLVKNDNSAWRIDLHDGYDFRSPLVINTVGGASYTRNLNGKKWGTIALPFALDVTATTARIFKLSSVNGETMTFTEVTEGTVAAGSVILYYNAAGGEVVLNGKNIAKTADGFNIQPAGVNGWFTAQSFTNQVIDDVTVHPVLKDYDVYGISENNFVNATKKLTLKPFRAFFLAKKSAGARARFNIHIEGNEENGIMDVENELNTTVNARYDAAGRRVNAPVNGINIIRMSDGTVRKVMR